MFEQHCSVRVRVQTQTQTHSPSRKRQRRSLVRFVRYLVRSAHTSLPASLTAAMHPGLHAPARPQQISDPQDGLGLGACSGEGGLVVGGLEGPREQRPASGRGVRAQVCGIPNQSEIGAGLASRPQRDVTALERHARACEKRADGSRAVGHGKRGGGQVEARPTEEQNRLKRAAKSRQAFPCNSHASSCPGHGNLPSSARS